MKILFFLLSAFLCFTANAYWCEFLQLVENTDLQLLKNSELSILSAQILFFDVWLEKKRSLIPLQRFRRGSLIAPKLSVDIDDHFYYLDIELPARSSETALSPSATNFYKGVMEHKSFLLTHFESPFAHLFLKMQDDKIAKRVIKIDAVDQAVDVDKNERICFKRVMRSYLAFNGGTVKFIDPAIPKTSTLFDLHWAMQSLIPKGATELVKLSAKWVEYDAETSIFVMQTFNPDEKINEGKVARFHVNVANRKFPDDFIFNLTWSFFLLNQIQEFEVPKEFVKEVGKNAPAALPLKRGRTASRSPSPERSSKRQKKSGMPFIAPRYLKRLRSSSPEMENHEMDEIEERFMSSVALGGNVRPGNKRVKHHE